MFSPSGTLVTNDVDVMFEAAVQGCGLALMAGSRAGHLLQAGVLEAVPEDWCARIPLNFLYYPSRRQNSAAFRAFVAAMREPHQPAAEPGRPSS